MNEGEVVALKVVALGKDGKVLVGKDASAVKVNAKVVEHGKGKKIIVFKYKPKKIIAENKDTDNRLLFDNRKY